jgi:hypothetical protein
MAKTAEFRSYFEQKSPIPSIPAIEMGGVLTPAMAR